MLITEANTMSDIKANITEFRFARTRGATAKVEAVKTIADKLHHIRSLEQADKDLGFDSTQPETLTVIAKLEAEIASLASQHGIEA
jgi:hypothetical protein